MGRLKRFETHQQAMERGHLQGDSLFYVENTLRQLRISEDQGDWTAYMKRRIDWHRCNALFGENPLKYLQAKFNALPPTQQLELCKEQVARLIGSDDDSGDAKTYLPSIKETVTPEIWDSYYAADCQRYIDYIQALEPAVGQLYNHQAL